MEQLAGLLPLILVFAVFWLLILRPARTRQRQMLAVQASLQPGARVVTTSGLYATVQSVDSDTVTLEVAPGVFSRYTRQAVVRVVGEPPTPEVPPQGTGDSGTVA
jgi:preprotein translocase subunit YajC